MSNRPCNKCILAALKTSAKRRGEIISVRKDPKERSPHGVRVTSHPRSVSGKARFEDEHLLYWFAKVPEKCAC